MQKGSLQTFAKSLSGRLRILVTRAIRDEAVRALKHFRENFGRRSGQTSPAPEPPMAPDLAVVPSQPEKAALLNINAASAEELTLLSGIGPARAKAIVQGRPYQTTDDLVRRQVVPAAVYDGIKDRIGTA